MDNPEKADEIRKARKMVLAMHFQPVQVTDEEVVENWQQLLMRSGRPVAASPLKVVAKGRTWPKLFLRVAAIFTVVTALILILNQFDENGGMAEADVEWVTKSAASGQKLQVMLPDGSRVKLNSESLIRYPADFEDDRRVVLEGEAYFDVRKRKSSPFQVAAGTVQVVVSGTRFGVAAYPEQKSVRVALEEGQVKVADTGSVEQTVMKPGELLMVHRDRSGRELVKMDPQKSLGWKDGNLSFYKESFDEMISKMERWYGVELTVREGLAIDSGWRFHGNFHDKSLGYVLGVVSYPDLFQYSISGKEVFIY